MRLPELALLSALLGIIGTANADPIDLKPFRATYTAEWKGITAAQSVIELTRSGGDTYTYSSVNTARGMFRMAFPDAMTQISTFKLVDGRIVPLSFRRP